MKKIIVCLTLLFCMMPLKAMDIAGSPEGSKQRSEEDSKRALLKKNGEICPDNGVPIIIVLKHLSREPKKNKMKKRVDNAEKRLIALEKKAGIKN